MKRLLTALLFLLVPTVAWALSDASVPTKFNVPWGNTASAPYIRVVPQASQIGIQNCAASLQDGFPPLTFVPSNAGGCPPFGADMNGILKQITQWLQWAQAGGPLFYDSTFSANVSGYPKQTILSNSTLVGCFWVNEVDNNTNNPDAGGANWAPFCNSPTVNTQSGTTYTVVLGDLGKLLTFTNATGTAVTIPAASSSGFSPFYTRLKNNSPATIIVTPSSGTINGASEFQLFPQETVVVVSDGSNWQTSQANAVRHPSPGNFFVATTGNDNNNCLTIATACLTLQAAVNKVYLSYDTQGANVAINIGTGTFCGATVSYPLPGAGQMILTGNGSANTVLQACSSGGSGLIVYGGAIVAIGSMKITGGGQANAIGLLIEYNSFVGINDDDVNFGAAALAGVEVAFNSMFNANFNGGHKLTFSGGGQYGFLITTGSHAITGVGVTNSITGTPAWSVAFVDAIVQSSFNWGSSSSWSGAATGSRYALGLLSSIDTEQQTGDLPGNAPGVVGEGSRYYYNTACVGVGTAACDSLGAVTGFGGGATPVVAAGSADTAGTVSVTAGTSPSSSGLIHIGLYSFITGPLGVGPSCTVAANFRFQDWPAATTFRYFYQSGTTRGELQIYWNSNGTSLTTGSTYSVSWTCE